MVFADSLRQAVHKMNNPLTARVKQAFDKQGFMSTIGAELRQVDSGFCCIAVRFTEKVTQQHGFFHGGLTATLADNAAGFAAYTLMDESDQPLSVEFKINFVAPAQGEELEARAKVLRSGRRLKHVSVEVYGSQSGSETLVAIALATIASNRAIEGNSLEN